MIDEIVFNKARKGDSQCFSELLEPIQDRLYKIAFFYMGNEDDALDCIHDSIIKAIRAINKLKEPQYFNTWITRITINTCKDSVKKKNTVEIADISVVEKELIHENKQIDDEIDLMNAINTLSFKERELIVMRYLEDMTIKDIAEKTKRPEGTIKSSISRTLKQLRLVMKGV